jgi:hypothetical protein
MVLIKYGSLLLSVFVLLLCPRLHAETLPEIKAVIDFVSVEERLGALLHYSQTYLDDQHERVTYRGTLYTAIRQLTVDGCEVKVRVVVQDRFSGSIAKHKKLSPDRLENTGSLVDDTVHEYDFALNDLEREGISDYLARPQDLLNGTGFQCEENSKCAMEWIRITAKGQAIRAREIDNGIQSSDVTLPAIALPVSGIGSASSGAKLFRHAAWACSGERRRVKTP